MSTNTCQCQYIDQTTGNLVNQGPSFSIPNGTPSDAPTCKSKCQSSYPSITNISADYSWQPDVGVTQRKAWIALVIFAVIIIAVIVTIVLVVNHFKKAKAAAIMAPPSGLAGGMHRRARFGRY